VEVAFGNPPQLARASLEFGASDTYVHSAQSKSYFYSGTPYNHSISSTYKPIGDWASGDFGWVYNATGYISQDSLHLGGLELENFNFLEATYTERITEFPYDNKLDGAVGLKLTNTGSNTNRPSFWDSLKQRKVLKENKVAIKFPREDPRFNDSSAEVRFGDLNHSLYAGDFVELPILNATLDYSLGHWQIQGESIKIGEKWKGDLADVIFVPWDYPYVSIPGFLQYQMVRILGLEKMEEFNIFPCHKRYSLPNITISFGGRDFVMTPWDYSIYYPPFLGQERCELVFTPSPRDGSGIEVGHLGKGFFKTVYTVFNADRRTISCECFLFLLS
jgi:hypothetical protein